MEKTIILATEELFPTIGETPAVGVYPLKMEFPQGIPPSLVVANDPSGDPRGVTYTIVIYFCADPSFPLLE